MKKLKIALFALMIALALVLGFNAWWLNSAPPEERRNLVWPGASTRGSAGPLKVDLSEDLTADGAACMYLGTRVEVRNILFYSVDKSSVDVKLVTGQMPLKKSALTYSLFEKDGKLIGDGHLSMAADMGPQETQTAIIRDARTIEALRIVIERGPPNNKR
jgi:hypothetical protein